MTFARARPFEELILLDAPPRITLHELAQQTIATPLVMRLQQPPAITLYALYPAPDSWQTQLQNPPSMTLALFPAHIAFPFPPHTAWCMSSRQTELLPQQSST